jgi:hypothetical protein
VHQAAQQRGFREVFPLDPNRNLSGNEDVEGGDCRGQKVVHWTRTWQREEFALLELQVENEDHVFFRRRHLLFFFNSCQEGWRQQETYRLEDYKLLDACQRVFVEKRLEALLRVTTAMSDVTGVYFSYTKEKLDAREADAMQEYLKALTTAREIINRAESLFDEDFNTDLDRYYEFHRAMMNMGMTKLASYRPFVADLRSQFDDICQAA